ncbi:TPA: hypothetical protein EYP13_04670, partial [Candidatus Micrarchaeota archaeon]|nr:hypothetical protein [Candidatus Micrarchaeota archaeon]
MAEKEQKTERSKPDADEILSQHIGDVHYRVFKLKEYFDNLNDVIHYYLHKFGPYLPMRERTDLAILGLEADKLSVELSEIVYNVQVLRVHAQMHIDRGTTDEFSVPDDVAEKLSESVTEIEKKVYEFAEHLNAFIHQIIETARREGIA